VIAMSIGVGIGDLILFATIIKKTIDDYADAPNQWRKLAVVVKGATFSLGSMKTTADRVDSLVNQGLLRL
jgi:hypothetical protein